jgi:hypothetical protein
MYQISGALTHSAGELPDARVSRDVFVELLPQLVHHCVLQP